MPLQRTEAIVIGSLDLGEADRLITFYSLQFGKIKAVARGSRRLKSRWGRSTQLLTHCMLVFYEKKNNQLHRLRQCDIMYSFNGLWEDLKKLTAGLYIAELVTRITPEGEENRELFYLITQLLSLLERGGDSETRLRIFEIRILSMLGYQPQIGHCIRCQQAIHHIPKISFSPIEGGVVCDNCLNQRLEGKITISAGSLYFLQQALRLSLSKIGRLGLVKALKPELKEMLHRYLTHHLDQEINSFRFLELLN
jgi:DNA repair protein RecO (recombination protein O)